MIIDRQSSSDDPKRWSFKDPYSGPGILAAILTIAIALLAILVFFRPYLL